MNSVFSFYTGAGFLDLGFEAEGFDVSMVNEFDPIFIRGYRHGRARIGAAAPRYGFHSGSVEELASGGFRRTLRDLVRHSRTKGRVGFVGGPPCPDFSVAGKNAGGAGDNGRLTSVYFDIVLSARPDFVVFENVEGLWRTRIHRQYYEDQKARLVEAGYVVHDMLANALSYGVPQDRTRIVMLAFLDGPQDGVPWHVGRTREGNPARDVAWPDRSPFGAADLPIPEEVAHHHDLTVEHWFRRNDVTNHPNAHMFFRPKSERIAEIEEGDVSKKSFKRLHRWRYSPTACYGHNEVHLHPYLPRRLSVAETLAIQSLPAQFSLPTDMSLSAAFKTIGNGVPYLMARGIAKTVAAVLTD